MRQRTRVAGLSVALVCAGILSACGDPPISPGRIVPLPTGPGPVAPAPPPVPPDIYKGSYTLSMELGDTCSTVPAAARTRTYSATIEPIPNAGTMADYLVTLSGATFAAGCGTNRLFGGLGCHQFLGTKYFGGLTFIMADPEWGDGGHIQERLPDGSGLTVVDHESPARFEGSILEASGDADVYYCAVADEMTPGCRSGWAYCRTNGLRLHFTRQP